MQVSLSFVFLKDLFIFIVCMSTLPDCMSVYHISIALEAARNGY